MWSASVALQATVENIRDIVWEIYYWDLRTPNNAKPYFFLNEINKKGLPGIYSAATPTDGSDQPSLRSMKPGGGHLDIVWVGMCRPGLQIGTPF